MRPNDLEHIEFGKANRIGSTPKHAWRTDAPIVDRAACVACELCVTFCPEGSIVMAGDHAEIDLTFCKGCGICETECPPGAISMAQEGGP